MGVTEPPFRVYEASEQGRDGYPSEWHATIKHLVREQADHRCARCFHPYRNGEHGIGEWSPCAWFCTHGGEARFLTSKGWVEVEDKNSGYDPAFYDVCEARWRILTVHHLDGDKLNCRWWNLVALCQRCHLHIQGKVVMEQVYPFEHTPWFRPYAAGFYAWKYHGHDLSREETRARIDDLLALEQMA